MADDEVEEDRVELKLTVVRTTADAYLVSDGDAAVWLPRSAVGYDGEFFYVPRALAKERGLI